MKNSCKITFEGLNINRLLTLLNNRGIALGEVTRNGKKCTVQVPARRSKQTIAILRERCYNILGIEYFGISACAKFAKKHFVMLALCLVLLSVIAISSRYCLKIEVSGDFDKDIVCQALETAGVKVGTDLHKLNINAVQDKLANELGSMYAVIKRSGSVLYVNAVAKKQIDPPIDLDTKRNIVAPRAGVVTRLVCEQGTPLVKVGDAVAVGDVLIEGRRVFNDGTSEDVYALGQITLTVSVTGFAPFDGTKTVAVETGNVFKCTGVVLFGKQYAKACPFERYTVTTEYASLFPLNIAICTNVYRETALQKVPATIEERLDELMQTALEQASETCDFEITDTVYDTTAQGVYATLYGQILIN